MADGRLGFLSLVCWLDDDERHVWQQHDCNGTTVRSMLPSTWQAGRSSDPTHNTPQDVTPSIHCTACGLHAFGTLCDPDDAPAFSFGRFMHGTIEPCEACDQTGECCHDCEDES